MTTLRPRKSRITLILAAVALVVSGLGALTNTATAVGASSHQAMTTRHTAVCHPAALSLSKLSAFQLKEHQAGLSAKQMDKAIEKRFCLQLLSASSTPAAGVQSASAKKSNPHQPSSPTDIKTYRVTIWRASTKPRHYYASAVSEFKDAAMWHFMTECGFEKCQLENDTHNLGGDDAVGVNFNYPLDFKKTDMTYCGTGVYDCHTTKHPEKFNKYGAGFKHQDTWNGGTFDFNMWYTQVDFTILGARRNHGCDKVQAWANYAHDYSSTSINGIGVGPYAFNVGWTKDNHHWLETGNPTAPLVKICAAK